MSYGKCKACGEEIQWVKLRKLNGETVNHPVDANPKKGLVQAVQTKDGDEVIAECQGDTPVLNFRKVYISHYATCLNADEFRHK